MFFCEIRNFLNLKTTCFRPVWGLQTTRLNVTFTSKTRCFDFVEIAHARQASSKLGLCSLNRYFHIESDMFSFHFCPLYCLVAIVQHDMQLERSTYEVLQILSMSLTDTTHLRNLFDKTIFKYDKDRNGHNKRLQLFLINFQLSIPSLST